MAQDYAAARRCFSRALDADTRNVATIVAWTQMEEQIGNIKDAGLIFERSLKQFAPGTDEKMQLWRAYELMEQRAGNFGSSQEIYRRYMQETIVRGVDESAVDPIPSSSQSSTSVAAETRQTDDAAVTKDEVEVSRWDDGSSRMKAEVWMNDGMIEGRVPSSTLKRMKQKAKKKDQE
jgi:tetratricopeptide (TPR) repeat protein